MHGTSVAAGVSTVGVTALRTGCARTIRTRSTDTAPSGATAGLARPPRSRRSRRHWWSCPGSTIRQRSDRPCLRDLREAELDRRRPLGLRPADRAAVPLGHPPARPVGGGMQDTSAAARVVERQGRRAQVRRPRASHARTAARTRSEAADPYRPLAGDFETDWRRAAAAIERALELITLVGPDGFGVFAEKWLPGFGLVPILAALRAEIDDRKLGEPERADLRRWYWCNVFMERYSSAVESKSRKDYLEMTRHWFDGGPSPTCSTRLKTYRGTGFGSTAPRATRALSTAAYSVSSRSAMPETGVATKTSGSKHSKITTSSPRRISSDTKSRGARRQQHCESHTDFR